MQTVEDRIDIALDAALEMTFPASDPIAVYIAESQAEAKDVSPRVPRTQLVDGGQARIAVLALLGSTLCSSG